MIEYSKNSFGIRLLFRLHGSAVSKALLPSAVSTLFIVIAIYGFGSKMADDESQFVEHPYAIGIGMVAFTFLLTFRANFSYNRYWEAVTAVHLMQSKWLDAAITISALHYQSSKFDKIRPPSFGDHPTLDQIRRRTKKMLTAEELENELDKLTHHHEENEEKDQRPNLRGSMILTTNLRSRLVKKKSFKFSSPDIDQSEQNSEPKRLSTSPDKSQFSLFTKFTSSNSSKPKAVTPKIIPRPNKNPKHPSLFLQEAAHLLSLNSAVALSTLRNDLEGSESPLALFEVNQPWPPVDPDTYSSQFQEAYWQKSRAKTILMYVLGSSRNKKMRTLYNAARPFRVIGGVSNSEIKLLQLARGPQAKIALVSMWLTEFVIREFMHGAVGGVPPPIMSRAFQLISDGMVGYHQARKVACVPFPFPHAQITSLFIVIIIFIIPILMIDYCNNPSFAIVMNFLTVLVFSGLHEVARELENPFQNAPNDIPLNNFQAQYNEAVITCCSGFHPDSWWEVPPPNIPEESE